MQKKEVSHITATRMQEVCSVGEGHTYTEFQWEGQIVISPDSQGSRGRPSLAQRPSFSLTANRLKQAQDKRSVSRGGGFHLTWTPTVKKHILHYCLFLVIWWDVRNIQAQTKCKNFTADPTSTNSLFWAIPDLIEQISPHNFASALSTCCIRNQFEKFNPPGEHFSCITNAVQNS